MQIEGLKGRTAIVTAAGQNLGRAIALAFAKAGANVVINGRTQLDKLQSVAREAEALGVQALPILADGADWPAVEAMVAQATARFGGLDIAVSAIGIRAALRHSRLATLTGVAFGSRPLRPWKSM